MILPTTAVANAGLCAQCIKIPPARRALQAAVNAEANPLNHAIELYSALIDELVEKSTNCNFAALSDSQFEEVRFYTIETLRGSFDYNEVTELGVEAVNEIDYYLRAVAPGYSLYSAMVQKLKSVSPLFNRNGKTVYLASWGMGPDEIGRLVRLLNDRPTFERYLRQSGITEDQVDAHNDA